MFLLCWRQVGSSDLVVTFLCLLFNEKLVKLKEKQVLIRYLPNKGKQIKSWDQV